MIRSFVAIDLPGLTKARLKAVAQQLRGQVPRDSVRWTRITGVHLTLKFLGDVNQSDLPQIKQALAQVGQRHAPFEFTIGGVGCFPNTRRPRVVWVGLQEESGVLAALQRDVDQSLVPLGFEPEKRRFHPHLTLGRVKRGIPSGDLRRLGQVLVVSGIGELDRVQATSLRLMRSELRSSGALYSSLAAVDLSKT